jgi:hypothetical protein
VKILYNSLKGDDFMTLNFFLKNYDFNEYEVKKIYIKNNKLYFDILMPIHLDLIANGYRPELDMIQEKTFVFACLEKNQVFPKNTKIEFSENSIFLNEKEIRITLSLVHILEQN